MLKTAAAAAGLALIAGLTLAHTTPADRARYVASVGLLLGFPTVAPTSPIVDGARAAAPPSGFDTVALDADAGGQFHATMNVRGRSLPAMVDTGATMVVLTFDDAASIGIHPTPSDFKYSVGTANGSTRVATTTLEAVRVGNVEARNVPALVSLPGALTGHSLLGMSFIKKLSGFEVDSGRLVLKQ